jgi:hypothetical protein
MAWPKRRASGPGAGEARVSGPVSRLGRQAVGQGAQRALVVSGQRFLGVGALELGLLDDHPLQLALAVGDQALGGEQLLGGGGGLAAQGRDGAGLAGVAVGAGLQLRGHGADQDRGPHRVAGVVRADQQGRRRIAAEQLQGRLSSRASWPRSRPSSAVRADSRWCRASSRARLAVDVVAGVDPLAAQGVQLAAQVDDLAPGVGGGLFVLGLLADRARLPTWAATSRPRPAGRPGGWR